MKKIGFALIVFCILLFCFGCTSEGQNNTPSDTLECTHSKINFTHGIAPTCIEDGYSDSEQCDSCYKVIKKSEVIKATGHTYDSFDDVVCNACGFFNSDVCAIVVSDKTAVRGDKNVAVTIAIKNNPGITSLVLYVSYDNSALDLTRVTYNSKLGGYTVDPDVNKDAVTLYWINALSDSKGDWVFATLYFDVSKTAAPKDYEISVSYDPNNIYDLTETNIYFQTINGKITVK